MNISDQDLLALAPDFFVDEQRAKTILKTVKEIVSLNKSFHDTIQKIQAYFHMLERDYSMFVFAIIWFKRYEKPIELE